MTHNPSIDDPLEELSCLREKAAVALGCIFVNEEIRCIQTLTCIASDYLSAMGKTLQAMQESQFTAQ